ncbi:hypothetical protein HFO06_31380 [Rhizobium leguminosarum]|uniref:hypothetical protein n=1 Tax=Rhizobium leguminosarum TaxID=384 RepID=UPI001C96181E|nr:hypothetical protein [Rhizobium leguminosarum]MBY5767536.1 hypothetical protein [Rhizobium leguminosarum]
MSSFSVLALSRRCMAASLPQYCFRACVPLAERHTTPESNTVDAAMACHGGIRAQQCALLKDRERLCEQLAIAQACISKGIRAVGCPALNSRDDDNLRRRAVYRGSSQRTSYDELLHLEAAMIEVSTKIRDIRRQGRN